MSWWVWVLVAVGLMAAATVVAGLWLRREWLAVPPAERRPWPEIRGEVGAALRDLWREWREIRAVHRQMDADSRKAWRELQDKRFERTRDKIRAEQPSAETWRRAFRAD